MHGPQLGGRTTRRPRPRPRPRVRGAADEPLRDAGPRRGGGGVPAGERAARAPRAPGEPFRPCAISPRSARRTPRVRRRARCAPGGAGTTTDADGPTRAARSQPARPPRRSSRRAPVPRRRPGPPRAAGATASSSTSQADPERRGGHGRVQGPGRSGARRCSRASPTSISSARSAPRRVSRCRSRRRSIVAPVATSSRSPGSGWTRRLRLRRRRGLGRGHPRRERRGLAAPPVPATGPRRRRRGSTRRDDDCSVGRSALPIAIAPMAAHGAGPPRRRGGDRARRGRRRRAVHPLDDVVAARSRRSPRRRRTARRWFQLYVQADPGRHATLVERAAAAGYGAIVLTVDLPVLGYRERDRRCGFELPAARQLRTPTEPDPIGRRRRGGCRPARASQARRLTWDDLATIRRWSTLPLVLKGILTAEDARLAVEHGVDGDRREQPRRPAARSRRWPRSTCWPSRRGRRRPGGVWVDGGVRRGLDIAIALALGARGVLVGRPICGRWRPAARPASSGRSRSCARSSRSRWRSSGRRARPRSRQPSSCRATRAANGLTGRARAAGCAPGSVPSHAMTVQLPPVDPALVEAGGGASTSRRPTARHAELAAQIDRANELYHVRGRAGDQRRRVRPAVPASSSRSRPPIPS